MNKILKRSLVLYLIVAMIVTGEVKGAEITNIQKETNAKETTNFKNTQKLDSKSDLDRIEEDALMAKQNQIENFSNVSKEEKGITKRNIKKRIIIYRLDDGKDLDEFKSYGSIDFDINLEDNNEGSKFKLKLEVCDVDSESFNVSPEIDEVFVNNHYLGKLTGRNNRNSTNSFEILSKYLKEGKNHIEIKVDREKSGWWTKVNYAEIIQTYDVDIESIKAQTSKWEKEYIYKKDEKNKAESKSKSIIKSKSSIKSKVIVESINSDKTSTVYKLASPKTKYSNKKKIYSQVTWKINGGKSTKIKRKGKQYKVEIKNPKKIGKYVIEINLKIYDGEFSDNKILGEKNFKNTLYMVFGKPNQKYKEFPWDDSRKKDTPPKEEDLIVDCSDINIIERALDWASKTSNKETAVSDIMKKIHENPCKWNYGREVVMKFGQVEFQYMDSADRLLKKGKDGFAQCSTLSDVLNILGNSIGIELKCMTEKEGFLTESKNKDIDNNKHANAYKKTDGIISKKAGRWFFTSHTYSIYQEKNKKNIKKFDPTFGIMLTKEENNKYAEAYKGRLGQEGWLRVSKGKRKGDTIKVTEIENPSGKKVSNFGWGHYYWDYTGKNKKVKEIKAKAINNSNSISFEGNNNIEEIKNKDNGLIDQLKLSVPIDVDKTEDYGVVVNLTDKEGTKISGGTPVSRHIVFSDGVGMENIHLEKGKQNLESYFFGYDIGNSKLDGPYTINVYIYDKEGKLVAEHTLSTKEYKYDEFTGCFMKNIKITEETPDIDKDGKLDSLDIKVNADILEAGYYSISGVLSTDEAKVSSPNVYKYLEKGNNTITLRTNGTEISRMKAEGPYGLWLNITGNITSYNDEYSTLKYTADSFQRVDVEFKEDISVNPLDTDNDGKYNQLVLKGKVNSKKDGKYTIGYIMEAKEDEDKEDVESGIICDCIELDLKKGINEFEIVIDGMAINREQEDGPYNISFTIEDEEGDEYDYKKIITKDYKYTDFTQVPARIKNIIDEINTGKKLEIMVSLNVKEAGDYSLSGFLVDNEDENVASTFTNIHLEKGEQKVKLAFSGRDIIEHEVAGSYRLVGLDLIKEKEIIDFYGIDYNTKKYELTDFVSEDIIFYETHSESVTDSNEDGKKDTLNVSVDAYIPEKGIYYYNARIVDANGREIGWADGEKELERGKISIPLDFDGRLLYGNGENGPFYIEDVSVYSDTKGDSSYYSYETKAYNYNDFAPCNVINGQVKIGNKPVTGASIYINGIDRVETNEQGEYVLKVLNDGEYDIHILYEGEHGVWDILQDGVSIGKGNLAKVKVATNKNTKVDFIAKQPKQLEVLTYHNYKDDIHKNTIYPNFRLTNTGDNDVKLSDTTLRYYFTSENKAKQIFHCDFSEIGSKNVVGNIIKMKEPLETANQYLEIGFITEDKVLKPGESFEILTRITSSDWSDYDQSNDYSFNSNGDNYTEFLNVPVYIDGEINYGKEIIS